MDTHEKDHTRTVRIKKMIDRPIRIAVGGDTMHINGLILSLMVKSAVMGLYMLVMVPGALYPERSAAKVAMIFSEDYWYIKKAKSVMHFILMTINGQHQHMLMIDSEGNIIDEYPESPWQDVFENYCCTITFD